MHINKRGGGGGHKPVSSSSSSSSSSGGGSSSSSSSGGSGGIGVGIDTHPPQARVDSPEMLAVVQQAAAEQGIRYYHYPQFPGAYGINTSRLMDFYDG